MILMFDIGNTRTSIGLYNDSVEDLEQFWILSADLADESKFANFLTEAVGTKSVKGAIIGSVVNNLNREVCSVLKRLYGIDALVVSHKSKLPVKISVEFPEKLGVDRIINGAYAYSIYKQSVIVVDCGSAITFDIVNDNGEFVGGIISLGLKNQLKSISSSTSALPSLSLKNIDTSIGKNTEDAILSGVVNGTASMVDGMLERCVEELNSNPVIVLTGGDSELLQKYLKTKIDVVDPKFTLMGLKYLYNLNTTC